MLSPHTVGIGVLVGLVLVAGGLITWRFPEWLAITPGSDGQGIGLWVVSIVAFVSVMLLVAYPLLGRSLGRAAYYRQDADDLPAPAQPDVSPTQEMQSVATLKQYLRTHYGPFWHHNVRLLLVVGEPAQIDAIAPGLSTDRWQHGRDLVLLLGGSVLDASEDFFWRDLSSRWRGLDGVVWALTAEQSADAVAMEQGALGLRRLARELGWHLPLAMWQVCHSAWSQQGRNVQAVGCELPAGCTVQVLEKRLQQWLEPLRRQGIAQMSQVMGHDFLYRLSRDLQDEGIRRWSQVAAPLLGRLAQGVPLRGVWFSLALAPRTDTSHPHVWLADPAWQGVLAAPSVKRRLGWSVPRVGYALALVLALLWGAGMLLSFATNRAHIAQVQGVLLALEQAPAGDGQRLAFNALVTELDRLDYRAAQGAPWYQRFGLNQNPALLALLWPRYVQVNKRLLLDPALASLQRELSALVKLPADSPERARRAPGAYTQLKAYLMLARPDKADARFLADTLGGAEEGLAPGWWQFYGKHLAAYPQWRSEADPTLVAQVRQVLLGQLGQRNAEASLYQQVLDAAANHYPALSLGQMVGVTDASALFSNPAEVPGVFTRQAWEGQVRQAIDTIAEARREEIDWVLSDQPAALATHLSPQLLRERLTARYFEDYGSAWLDFLNRLRWQPANSLADVIDQLSLMSDTRQSPLIALMNTLAYQGQAGTRHQALGDSLLQSAQKLVGQDKVELIDQQLQEPQSPLDATFGPLLALLGKDPQSRNDSLSLQAFLSRVTRVRLKLQQVSHAPDPQEMTQALAQSVFQGKSVDLTDTQSYGSLLAASLGAEWAGIGQTLFVQPLEQAWQRVLQPSAASLNRQWQRSIGSHWHSAFAGRYPFAATRSDASLPMLGQMIRADSGRIEQFLQHQLGGVLRKEGNRWVADSRHSQGLRFNPKFLAAINQLSHLADVLYTDGGMGLGFELQGKAVRDVVQTTFILNGERHQYFNQRENWQRFNWPGRSDHPGASLSWTSISSGERLFGDYPGTWGLIRLLEQAQVTPLDDGDSRYRVVLKAADGLGLTWHLRTELGAGPMALLQLRDFRLPSRIFLEEGVEPEPYALNGSNE